MADDRGRSDRRTHEKLRSYVEGHRETRDGSLTAGNWRPARAGALLAALLVLVASGLLARPLGVVPETAVTAAGGAGLAVTCWLAARERYSATTTALAVVVAAPTGGLLLVGTTYVTLAQAATILPVGTVFVVIGVALATFGAVSQPGEATAYRSVGAAARVVTGASLPLVAVAGLLVALGVKREEGIELLPALPTASPLAALSGLEPAGEALVPPLGSFLALTAFALVCLRAALTRLPVEELLDDRTTADDGVLDGFHRLVGLLGHARMLFLVGVVLLGVRLGANARLVELWTAVPPVLSGLLDALARSSLLRSAAVWLSLGSLGAILLAAVARRLYRMNPQAHAGKAAVVVGVAAVLALGWLGHEPLLASLLEQLTRVLPAGISETVIWQVESVLDYYGGGTVAVGLFALWALFTAVVVFVVQLGMVFRVVPRAAGHALAAVGLLVAAGFATTLSVAPWRGLAVVVAAVAVWDLGRFGAGLGRDVGRRGPSLPVQFVHTLAAVLVGVFTVALAMGLRSLTAVAPLPAGTAAPVALFVAVGAVFLTGLLLAR